jgi:hypothetical protein
MDLRSGRYQDRMLVYCRKRTNIRGARLSVCGMLVSTWRPSLSADPIIRLRGGTQCRRLLNIISGSTLWDPYGASETSTHFYKTELTNLHKEFNLTLRQKYISYYRMGTRYLGKVSVVEMLCQAGIVSAWGQVSSLKCLRSYEVSFFSGQIRHKTKVSWRKKIGAKRKKGRNKGGKE